MKYQLMDSGLAILQEYGTPYFAAIYQLAHNYKFSLLHARNQNQQDLLWIFEDDNRLEQNLFGDIDLKSTQISAFRFDQINSMEVPLLRRRPPGDEFKKDLAHQAPRSCDDHKHCLLPSR